MAQTSGLRILSLCGGGTRGVISLVYLQAIEDRVGPLHKYFDVVCGTSTGGIIAFCIAFKKWPVKQIAVMYDEFASKIFPNKAKQFINKALESAKAETELFVEFLARHLENNTLLDYSGPDYPRVFVTSTRSEKVPQQVLLSNFELNAPLQERFGKLGMKVTLVDALRATTAAPTYFPPIILGDMTLKDGGLMANNPSMIALQLSYNMWREKGIEVLICVGSGISPNREASKKKDFNSPASQVVLQALALTTSSEVIHKEVCDHLESFHKEYKLQWPSHYLWLNCPIPADLSSLSITEPKQLDRLKQIAKKDVESKEVQAKLSILGTQ